jgi:hypothetical protein
VAVSDREDGVPHGVHVPGLGEQDAHLGSSASEQGTGGLTGTGEWVLGTGPPCRPSSPLASSRSRSVVGVERLRGHC